MRKILQWKRLLLLHDEYFKKISQVTIMIFFSRVDLVLTSMTKYLNIKNQTLFTILYKNGITFYPVI